MFLVLELLNLLLGRLGGSVSYVSDFGSGHDLTVCGFEGLCPHSAEPAWESLSLSLSLSLPLPDSCFLPLSLKKLKKKKSLLAC